MKSWGDLKKEKYEINEALRYLAQVREDPSAQYTYRPAHDRVMNIALEAENERLRRVIKAAEQSGPPALGNGRQCPWCPADTSLEDRRHYDYCAAFTPDGQVK